MGRPLEDRFPTLYHHISEEREARTGKLIEKRVPKDTPPTLRDVVTRILEANGIHSSGLAGDLVSSISEFTKQEEAEAEAERPRRGGRSRAATARRQKQSGG